MIATDTTTARIEIDGKLLMKLLAHGELHACDLRCLDASSKRLLQKLCLASCALCLRAKHHGAGGG
ncbi:MAG TPA: hypothetical protein VMH83_00445 [Candidatus Acidoferrum sp.]|nr:hypothetical protein [Candidatus Acidoferrum sp.]